MPLKATLTNLIAASERSGATQLIRLPHGLIIQLKVSPAPGETTLRLWRVNSEPSDREFKTVIANWPYPVDVQPEVIRAGGVQALIGHWPTPARSLPTEHRIK